jgi:hypothetical protein
VIVSAVDAAVDLARPPVYVEAVGTQILERIDWDQSTHGMGLIQEAIVQLRGEAGERQVAGASVAAVSSGGLTPGGALLLRAGT